MQKYILQDGLGMATSLFQLFQKNYNPWQTRIRIKSEAYIDF